jgi:SAM-dependent methyltransferase
MAMTSGARRRAAAGAARGFSAKIISVWEPTPLYVVTEALRLAELTPADHLFDLGCGDGRVVVRAAKLFQARATGFDIDPTRIREARDRAQRLGVSHLVSIRRQDLLAIPDLHRATVVYLFLPPRAIIRLRPLLRRNCRAGTRVVSVWYWIPNWIPRKTLILRYNGGPWRIGLWII